MQPAGLILSSFEIIAALLRVSATSCVYLQAVFCRFNMILCTDTNFYCIFCLCEIIFSVEFKAPHFEVIYRHLSENCLKMVTIGGRNVQQCFE